MQQEHGFFIALAYGISAVALIAELAFLYGRSRRLRREAEPKERP